MEAISALKLSLFLKSLTLAGNPLCKDISIPQVKKKRCASVFSLLSLSDLLHRFLANLSLPFLSSLGILASSHLTFKDIVSQFPSVKILDGRQLNPNHKKPYHSKEKKQEMRKLKFEKKRVAKEKREREGESEEEEGKKRKSSKKEKESVEKKKKKECCKEVEEKDERPEKRFGKREATYQRS